MALAQLTRGRRSGRPSRERLRMVAVGSEDAAPVHIPGFAERVIRPLMMRAMSLSGGMASKSTIDNLRDRLMQAGWPGQMQAQQWFTFKLLLAPAIGVAMFMLVFAYFWWRKPTMDFMSVIMTYGIATVFGAMMGYMGPDFYINKKIKQRRKEMQLDLPDMIDLLTVSVEAGLGFDAAIARVGDRFKGALGDEFGRVRQEVQMGRPRSEALREMARRCNVDDLSMFVTSLIQAEQLGVSMGQVLRVQSEQMRRKRAQRAREQAQKAPVKMMIPLVLFIFPTLFIVIMGPACIQGLATLKESGLF